MDIVTVYVDSKNRDSNLYPSGNSYVLHLTNPITDVVQVDLVSAKIPNTQYNLADGTAALTFNGTVMNLIPGYYTAAALVDEINLRLATQFSNVRWESFDGRFLFQNNGPFTLVVSNSISKLLGLTPGTHTSVAASSNPAYAQSLAASAHYIKSAHIVDLTVDEYLFLDINELRTPTTGEALAMNPNGSGTYSGGNARNSFAMIPVSINSGTVKAFSESADYAIKVEYPHPINKISRLTIDWIDGNGNSIDFHGFNNNSFVLRFHKAKKEEPPPPPAVDMVELRRIMEDMITVQKPKEPEVKRPLVGRWTLIIFLLIAAIGYYTLNRVRAVVPSPIVTPVQRVTA
jgi:hypothetical protein